MKKLILTFVLLGVFVIVCKAQQHCSDTINTITTDWNSDQSNNNWNWTQEFFNDAYIKNRTLPSTIRSPFYPAITGQNPNMEHFYTALGIHGVDGLDFHPEDGWELLIKDFGYCNTTPCNNSTAVDNPFFALYNRHLGLIRAFYMISEYPAIPQQGAMIQLQIANSPNRQNAMLAPAYAISKPVESFTKEIVQSVGNFYVNNDDYWLYADFPVTYDPCICNYDSKIVFSCVLIQSGSLELTGTATGKMSQIVGDPISSNVNVSVPFQLTFDNAKDIFKLANKSYKEWDGYKKETNKFIDKNKTDIKNKLNIEIDLLKTFTSTMPYIGTAVGLYQFFITGGKKKAQTQTPTPIAFESTLITESTGQIGFNNVFNTNSIWTPGSPIQTTLQKPTYDNLLGVFNLLYTPTLLYADYEAFEGQYTDPETGEVIPFLAPTIRQYKLKDDLKFVWNKASNLELIKVDASYILENNAYHTIPDMTSQGLNPLTLVPGNYIQKPVEFGIPNPAATMEDRYKEIGLEINQWPIDPWDYKMISLRTPYTPLSCFNQRVLTLYTTTSSVKVKLIATFKRKDNIGQEVIIVNTFPVKLEKLYSENPSYYNLLPTPTNLFDKTIGTLYTRDFLNFNGTGQPAFVDVYRNNQVIHLNAITTSNNEFTTKTILIDNGTTVSNAKLIAGESISVNEEATLLSGTLLSVSDFPASCDRSIQEMVHTPQEIANFCKAGGIYDRHSLSKKEEETTSNHSVQLTYEETLNISPNPTSGTINLGVISNDEQIIRVEAIDITGKIVYTSPFNYPLVKGDNQLLLDLEALDTGIYFIKVLANDKQLAIKKLLVSK